MALSFPLLLGEFFNPLGRVDTTMDLGSAVQSEVTQGGEVIQSAYGARLWTGKVTVRGNTYTNLDQVTARAKLLRQAGASFLVTHPWREGPQADPTGSILGASTPTIVSVAGNMRDVTINGLPAGYLLTNGDLLEFTYLSSPLRYALHEVVTPVTANGGGAAVVEVMPPLRPGYSTPMSIRLVEPRCKAVMIPDSYQAPVFSRAVQATYSFSWQQTLR